MTHAQFAWDGSHVTPAGPGVGFGWRASNYNRPIFQDWVRFVPAVEVTED